MRTVEFESKVFVTYSQAAALLGTTESQLRKFVIRGSFSRRFRVNDRAFLLSRREVESLAKEAVA